MSITLKLNEGKLIEVKALVMSDKTLEQIPYAPHVITFGIGKRVVMEEMPKVKWMGWTGNKGWEWYIGEYNGDLAKANRSDMFDWEWSKNSKFDSKEINGRIDKFKDGLDHIYLR